MNVIGHDAVAMHGDSRPGGMSLEHVHDGSGDGGVAEDRSPIKNGCGHRADGARSRVEHGVQSRVTPTGMLTLRHGT